MVHAQPLGLQIVSRVRARRNDDGHASHDGYTEAAKTRNLCRVVRHQFDGEDAEVFQHVARDVVSSRIVRKAQNPVRVDCVVTMGLQSVCPYLVGEADTATFLSQIQYGSSS